MHHRDDRDTNRKINALISYYLHIPFPEDLENEVWAEKWAQIKWLTDKGIIGSEKSKNG